MNQSSNESKTAPKRATHSRRNPRLGASSKSGVTFTSGTPISTPRPATPRAATPRPASSTPRSSTPRAATTPRPATPKLETESELEPELELESELEPELESGTQLTSQTTSQSTSLLEDDTIAENLLPESRRKNKSASIPDNNQYEYEYSKQGNRNHFPKGVKSNLPPITRESPPVGTTPPGKAAPGGAVSVGTGKQTKSSSNNGNARRQTESMEEYQKQFYTNGHIPVSNFSATSQENTYQGVQGDAVHASASKMREEYLRSSRPSQGTYPSSF